MSGTGLLAALQAVQKEAPALPKDKTNPHFKSKYTGLDTIVEKIGPLLNKHGLVWTTLPSGTHDQPMLSYRLAHADTGEVIEGSMPLLLDKPTAQALGSALTYARRYSLCAVLNLVTDEDDDGSAAGGSGRSAKPAASTGTQGSDDVAPSQRRLIYDQASGKLAALELLNILRKVKGADPLTLSEDDAMTRLDAAITNLNRTEGDAVLKLIREAIGS